MFLKNEFFLTSLPTLLLLTSGVVGAAFPFGKGLRSGLQHFAAGVVFSVVAVELLPELRLRHAPWEMAVSFTAGVVIMIFLRISSKRLEKVESVRMPFGMLTAVAIDLVFDGLLLGIGFAAGEKIGTLMALGLAAEAGSLGMAVSTDLKDRAVGVRRIFTAMATLALVFALGTWIGVSLFGGAGQHTMVWLLSIGAAALLYLVTEELLVEAHRRKDNPLVISSFFFGFLAFLLLGMFI